MSTHDAKEIGLASYLAVKTGAKAVEFYTTIFGAKESFRLTAPEGQVCPSALHFKEGGIPMLAEEMQGRFDEMCQSMDSKP